MKYSVEIENGIAKETLIFNGKEYNRTTKKTGFGSTSDDAEFNEQLESEGLPSEVLDSEVLDEVFETLDSFLVDVLRCNL